MSEAKTRALVALMTLRECAEYLGFSESTLHGWRHRGEGPPGLKVAGRVRYRREEVDHWLEEQSKQATA